ncbi:MAG: hypothetical protein K2L46_03530 [Paramuribaculum sp.]|nr:hypothetical protein [Paramuribaculum sp.]MDE6488329.1 hypothetical protein [Paramuribaculum sp.]
MNLRIFFLLFCSLQCTCSFAEIHTNKWDKFDGKWTNDSISESSIFSILIDKGENGEVMMDFFLQSTGTGDNMMHRYPVYAPLHEEGGECTDILWGGPSLVTYKDLDDDGNLSVYQRYEKSKEWSYVFQQIRSNANGVILFEVETNAFPLDDDYSIKAKVEHELGLVTATAEYCIYRFAYAAIPKSHNQIELICLGLCGYYYGNDRDRNYGFVGGLFDNGKKLNGYSKITLNR